MDTEIEAKFLSIDKNKLRKLLKNIGAELVQPERIMQRTVFELPEPGSYLRVRNEGNQITMSFKHLDERSIEGMKEICLSVDNYDNAIKFLKAIGQKPKAEQDTMRESWVKDGVEIDIDTWPWVPSFVEIEGKSAAEVAALAVELGFQMEKAYYGSVEIVYQQDFDVTEDEINFMPEIKFKKIPAWLEARRKKTTKKE